MDRSPQAELIERFFAAFARLDSDAMRECYAPDAAFSDPVFDLEGREQIAAMWRMLCENVRAKGRDAWALEMSGLRCEGDACRAHWEPRYRFSATGRRVHNIVDSEFTFVDGLIATHRDAFDFWRWARQALGAPGFVLGWSKLLRDKVRRQAAANLAAFEQRSS